ncbi:MAG TPA: coproporphyrinogen III oxidase [Kofleriaceae bacterium]|nr:coproporphyrinogen III oxidase [Kofleriaceae bacterium]
MPRIDAQSPDAGRARELLEELQQRFAAALQAVSERHGEPIGLAPISWLRDDGRHGGGTRLVAADSAVFNRAAINVSQVHYDDDPGRRLGSATALSTIIHPQAPRAPSVHIHLSWTEMRDETGYWRIMADLNPAIEDTPAIERFRVAMRGAAPALYDAAAAQGDRYFWIPALGRHRGVTHYYLEGYSSGDRDADLAFARRFGQAMTDRYASVLDSALTSAPEPTEDERRCQLEYHTLYLFQVLTLDRGTTSGLLVHDQNDVGILGSLPARIDRQLFASWANRLEPPQDELVRALVAALPDTHPCEVADSVRAELARVVRAHYGAHPDALALQASGDVTPPTVDNHLAPR